MRLAYHDRSALGSLVARLALPCCLLIPLAGWLFALQGQGTVHGTVIDAQGRPLVGVELRITCSCDLTYEGRTTTNSNGSYALSGVSAGGGVNVTAFVDGVIVARGGGVLMQDGESITIDVYPLSSERKATPQP